MRFVIVMLFAVIVTFAPAQAAGSYEDGLKAFEAEDYKTAYDIWLPLAEAGDPKAQQAIGVQYELGHGVKKNIDKAIYWYKINIFSKHPSSMFNYGRLLMSGDAGKIYFKDGLCWIYASESTDPELVKSIERELLLKGIPQDNLMQSKGMVRVGCKTPL